MINQRDFESNAMKSVQLEFKAFLRQNKLILPEQPNNDDFLDVIDKVFHFACIFGVLGSRSVYSYVWSTIILCTLLFIEVNAIWKVIKALAGIAVDIVGHRSITARFAGTIFYSISIMSLILASRLFHSWRDVSAAWTKAERSMALKVPIDKTLKKRMYLMAGFMLTFAIIEHALSVVSLVGLDCPKELILRRYVLLSHGFMILKTEYSDWFAIPILIVSCLASLLWNFQDVLLVLISLGLASRYHRLNQCLIRICALDKKQMAVSKKTDAIRVYTWRKLREAYVRQATLVRKMDGALGGLVILSATCNFYFICLQLFMGITQGSVSTRLRQAYYFTSLLWLCVRVTSVVMAASSINVNSQSALKTIYTYDTHVYNVEVERLQNQLSKDYVALSGMGFFYLNKTILLQMAASIITYELVLIQFDDKSTDATETLQLNMTALN